MRRGYMPIETDKRWVEVTQPWAAEWAMGWVSFWEEFFRDSPPFTARTFPG